MTTIYKKLPEEFYRNVARRADEILNGVPAQTNEQLKEELSFSEKYLNWKRNFKHNPKRNNKLSPTVKRIIIIAAIISALIFCAMSVDAVRNCVYKLFMFFKSDHVVATYGYESDSDAIINEDENAIMTYYEPTYIPDGYFEVDRERTDVGQRILYSDGVNVLEYKQNRFDTISQIDTEQHSVFTVSMNGLTATYFNGDDGLFFMWADEHGRYVISGEADVDVIVSIAQSLSCR